jgi:hypothetical protein
MTRRRSEKEPKPESKKEVHDDRGDGRSGNVGSKVADLLLLPGIDVRAFGQSAERLEALGQRGAAVQAGNAKNPDDLRLLFKAVDAAMVVLPDDLTDPQFVANRSHNWGSRTCRMSNFRPRA